MSTRWLSFSIVLLLAGCTRAGGDCVPVQGWEDGRNGNSALPGCRGSAYIEAHRLGTALFALRSEQQVLERDIDSLPTEQQGVVRRRQRQLQVDIDAILGLARINGWPGGEG